MGTDRAMLARGIKFLVYTLVLMFTAPVVIFQAFKNQGHPWYLPVLITGLLLGAAAIAVGFYSVKVVVDAFFGQRKK